MKNERAFVRYTTKGKIVPGSLVITEGYPAGPALWQEVSVDLCCNPPLCICYTVYVDEGEVINYQYKNALGKLISGTLTNNGEGINICAVPGSVTFQSINGSVGGSLTVNSPCDLYTACSSLPIPPDPIMNCYCYVITNVQEATQYYSYKDCPTNTIIHDVEIAPGAIHNVCTKANYPPVAEDGSALTIEACVTAELCTQNGDCAECSATPPCCNPGTINVEVTANEGTINGITVDDTDSWYDSGSLGIPVNQGSGPREAVLYGNVDGTLTVLIDNVSEVDPIYFNLYINCGFIGCWSVAPNSSNYPVVFSPFTLSNFETDCVKMELTNSSAMCD